MYAVIRIRGKANWIVEDTMKMLRLNAVNNCVVVQETPDYRGMMEKVKDFVAFGTIDLETFLAVLKKRGRLLGNKRLTDENVKELGYDTVEKMAKDIFEGKTKIKNIPKLIPVFRLTPPSKGHKSVLEHYPKGSLGNWGNEIKDLIERMI